MALQISSLNSGSNGNCYYIGNDTEAVLVDAGLSCRETEKRMLLLGLDMKKIKAIFISHEHTDHICGLPVISKKYSLPVYITQGTYAKSGQQLLPSSLHWLKAQQSISIGNLSVTAFPKQHDAADAHSFIICCNGITVGVFTDIGEACSNVIRYFSQCNAAFLESNYDEDMLENGQYPVYLKTRIRSSHGHLSNRQALEIFTAHRPPFMSHLLLSHLSKENNDPLLAKQLFETHALQTKIIVASRCQATEVFLIEENYKTENLKIKMNHIQLALFE